MWILVNQDDPNWWQARLAEDNPEEPAKLIPSRELEEKRKAYVRPEANYTTKIGLCGTLTSRKKRKALFRSKTNTEYDKAEQALYEEVTLMKPFRRKVLMSWLSDRLCCVDRFFSYLKVTQKEKPVWCLHDQFLMETKLFLKFLDGSILGLKS